MMNEVFFQEGSTIRVHEQAHSVQGEDGVVGLAFLFHRQHVLEAALLGGHRHHPEGTPSFEFLFNDFPEFFYGQ